MTEVAAGRQVVAEVHAHNDFLDATALGGLLGLAWLAVLGLALYRMRSRERTARTLQNCVLIVGLSVAFLTGQAGNVPGMMVFFAVFYGLGAIAGARSPQADRREGR